MREHFVSEQLKKARKLEKQGDFTRAAELYLQAGEYDQAIALFTQENMLIKAAKVCERIGRLEQAAECYTTLGDFNHAGELYKRANNALQAAISFKKAKRLREAAELYESIGISAEAARIYESLSDFKTAGEKYIKANMVRSAAVCFEKAASLENPMGHTLGKNRIEDANYRALILSAAEAWRRVPNLQKCAQLFEKIQNWKEAGACYDKAGEVNAALACYERGNFVDLQIALLRRTNQNDKAIKLAARISGDSGDPLKAAEIADSLGDTATAAEYYEKAGDFARAADRYEAISDHMLAAEMNFRAGNYEKAARLYEQTGNFETAADLYEQIGIREQAIRLHVHTKNYLRAAKMHLESKENEEALRLLLRIEDNHPSINTAKMLRAICYFRLGKIENGIAAVKTLLSLPISSDTVDVHYEYAIGLYEDGQIPKALIEFQKVVKFDKDYKESRQFLNWCAAMQEEITAELQETVVGELPIGMTVVDRYELLEIIGKGGMGIVYRAADRELDIAVALKILKPKYSYDPDFIEIIKREVTLARRLSHSSIIKIYDLNRAGNLWFISMEYLAGEELKNKIQREGPLPLPLIISIGRQILSALVHSHDQGIIHADIKPHNIFLNNKGQATLVDFGISQALGARQKQDTQSVLGTPEYISPEQITGHRASVQSDLYSLGVTFYEMTTGILPFAGDTIDDILDKQLDLIPPAPKSVRRELPDWLSNLITKLIQKQPENRFPSALDVLKLFPGSG